MEEIIGYRLKSEYYKYESAAIQIGKLGGCGWLCDNSENKFHQHKSLLLEGKCVTSDSDAASLFKEALILDLWFEPVYNDKSIYKVGDWITVIKIPTIENHWLNNTQYRTFKLTANPTVYKSGEMWSTCGYIYDSIGSGYGIEESCFRLATYSEIQEALISVAKEKGFVINSNIISLTGDKFKLLGYALTYLYDGDVLTASSNSRYQVIYKNGEWAKIIEQPNVVINTYHSKNISGYVKNTVANTYVGEFFDTYVMFGDVEIEKEIFITINRCNIKSNRQIDSINIGDLKFNKKQIKIIAEYFS
jgi:hypothetical protein